MAYQAFCTICWLIEFKSQILNHVFFRQFLEKLKMFSVCFHGSVFIGKMNVSYWELYFRFIYNLLTIQMAWISKVLVLCLIFVYRHICNSLWLYFSLPHICNISKLPGVASCQGLWRTGLLSRTSRKPLTTSMRWFPFWSSWPTRRWRPATGTGWPRSRVTCLILRTMVSLCVTSYRPRYWSSRKTLR